MTGETQLFFLSHLQAAEILDSWCTGGTVPVSLDLGLSRIQACIHPEWVEVAGRCLRRDQIERIAADEGACFSIRMGPDPHAAQVEKLQVFSEFTGRACSLVPTSRAPALLLSGTLMHRIKGVDPLEDTRRKLEALRPIVGECLDTATGLGYTAIELARSGADRVVTVELDPAVDELSSLNPWSAELYADSRIERLSGDAADIIVDLEDDSFSRLLHDPPVINLAGELYSGAFYGHLYRVLRTRGRLFHYIGNPHSPSGHRTTRGVVRRLQEAGFTRIRPRPAAFGVAATK